MKRHRFEPGALAWGLVLLFFCTAFALDAGGVWNLSDTGRSVPMAAAGIALAAVVAILTQAVRAVRGLRARRRTRGGPAPRPGRPHDAA